MRPDCYSRDVTPTPTPLPVFVQMVGGSEAPWWGVPAIAGGFLLLGGFLSFLFARWNESSKHKRERDAQAVKELVELGAQVILAANAVRDIGLIGLRRSVTEFTPIVATKGGPAFDEFSLATARFRLVMPLEMNEAMTEVAKYTLILLVPPFSQPGQEWALGEQSQAIRAFTNALRELQGHRPFGAVDKNPNYVSEASKSLSLLADELLEEDLKRKATAGE